MFEVQVSRRVTLGDWPKGSSASRVQWRILASASHLTGKQPERINEKNPPFSCPIPIRRSEAEYYLLSVVEIEKNSFMLRNPNCHSKADQFWPSLANSNQIFLPSATPGSFFSTFVARVDGHPEDHLAEIRDTIQSVDPQVAIFGAKTLEQRLNEVFADPKFYLTAIWTFAGFALLLAVIGIYGIVSHAVVQRTQETGIPRQPKEGHRKMLQRGTSTLEQRAPSLALIPGQEVNSASTERV